MRLTAALLVALLVSCTTAPAPRTAPSTASTGFDLTNLDRSVSACTDFFQHAIGGWITKNPIPAAYPSWGNFYVLDVRNQERMRTILEESTKNRGPAGTDAQRVGDFYASCMDEAAIERAGFTPLQPELDRINALTTTSQLPQIVAHFHSYQIPVLIGFGSTPDAKNSQQNVAGIGQSGLGLPDRDYYTNDDPRSKEIRERYVQHIARMLALIGDSASDAAEAARNIMALETGLARASMTNVELRDPNATYNKMTAAEVQALAPAFKWSAYVAAINARLPETMIVAQPDFLREVQKQIETVPVETWRDYLRWHLVNDSAPSLSSKFVEERFEFRNRFLRGSKEILPRWKRCAAFTDAAMGEAVGRLWTEKYFPETAKAEALEMVRNLMSALREDISTLSWMSPATRQQALGKLVAFGLKIGYPDRWRDYSAMKLSQGAFAKNAIEAARFEFQRDLSKIGNPVDRNEWFMSPPTVNAYNNPLMNEIVFPAGILQAPFYDPNADDAYNYGGMGAVIGHELIHGFDDQGRQFDARGNLADWWTAEDKTRFLERAKCVSEQFGAFEVAEGVRMTGDLVLGEAIADLGGLEVAYAAYRKSQEGKPRQMIDGFSPEQRFFLGFAQVWATVATKEAERLQVTTDPHPLPRYRVNGTVSNIPEFAAAFSCKTSDPMVRSDTARCDIW